MTQNLGIMEPFAIQSFYGNIDKIEFDENKWYIEIHSLSKAFVDTFSNSETANVQTRLLDMESYVFVISISTENAVKLFKKQINHAWETDWILFNQVDKSAFPSSLFINDAIAPIETFIANLEFVDPSSLTGAELAKKITLDNSPEATKDEIEEALINGKNFEESEFVAAYNVGQGSCAAICRQDCVPLIYFDLGGGCNWNAKTYTNSLKFCFTTDPPIILSHWDQDHYQSAILDRSYQMKTWIVPKQKIGPKHLKFFLRLTKKYIWPSNLSNLKTPWGEIHVCQGPSTSKNDSGLAFDITLRPKTNTIKNVLLPSDSAYKYIPIVRCRTFDGIMATHHGANFETNNSPIFNPTFLKAIVYSFGYPNTYNHPKSKSAHSSVGWTVERETVNGNIAFYKGQNILLLGCKTRTCQLNIMQQF